MTLVDVGEVLSGIGGVGAGGKPGIAVLDGASKTDGNVGCGADNLVEQRPNLQGSHQQYMFVITVNDGSRPNQQTDIKLDEVRITQRSHANLAENPFENTTKRIENPTIAELKQHRHKQVNNEPLQPYDLAWQVEGSRPAHHHHLHRYRRHC